MSESYSKHITRRDRNKYLMSLKKAGYCTFYSLRNKTINKRIKEMEEHNRAYQAGEFVSPYYFYNFNDFEAVKGVQFFDTAIGTISTYEYYRNYKTGEVTLAGEVTLDEEVTYYDRNKGEVVTEKEKIYIPSHKLGRAKDGDTVEIRVWRSSRSGYHPANGGVLKVIK